MHRLSYKKLSLPFLLVLLVLCCLLPRVEAAALKTEKLILPVHGYKITAYDVQVKVQENNVLDITERITAHFAEPKHGIYRSIPLINKMSALINQEKVTYIQKAKISNVSVVDGRTGQVIPIDMETKSDLVLKIGDTDKTMTGDKTYVIKYSYALAGDGRKEFDELYYNLIGDKWDTNIGNISFWIEMPKAFDAKDIKFMIGTAEADALVPYKVEGNVISGTVEDVLGSGRGLTIRLELPKGYFSSVEKGSGKLWLVLTAGMMAVSVLLFILFGRDKKLKPRDTAALTLNPAEAGYLLAGDAPKKGRMALLLHWANQGYLALESDAQDKISLTKLKEADENLKPYEHTMFNALFVNGDRVTSEELKTQFIGVMNKVDSGVREFFAAPSNELYTAASCKSRMVSYLFAFLCSILFSAKIFGDCYSLTDYLTIGAAVLVVLFLIFPFIFFIEYYARKNGRGSLKGVAVTSCCLMLMLGVLLGLAEYADALDPVTYALVLAIGVCGFFGAVTRKRTIAGNQLLGEVIGLQEHIKAIGNRENLDESQFYPLLPYAFTFGLADKWADAFKRFELDAPHWFRGRLINLFSTMYFTNLVSDTMTSFESSMTYYDSSSSDGGGGGGGGGAGGGGGGSW